MSVMDRRDFIKSFSAALGAVALAEAVPALAVDKKPAGGKVKTSGKIYEVFALKYAGPFERKLAMPLFNTGWNEDIAINFYTWVIRDQQGEVTLVDTGTGTNLAKERKLTGFVPPEELVSRLGVSPEQVTRVVLTHMHYDHAGGMDAYPELFPKAKFYVQKREFDFWLNNPLSQRAPYKNLQSAAGNRGVGELAKGPRLVLVDGDKVIGPDMQLLLTPGHTPGLQSILLPTAKGQAIVASDSAHLARSFKDDVPSCLITDMLAWLRTYDKLRAKAPLENIFPGHDALMLTDYPKVAEDITKLA